MRLTTNDSLLFHRLPALFTVHDWGLGCGSRSCSALLRAVQPWCEPTNHLRERALSIVVCGNQLIPNRHSRSRSPCAVGDHCRCRDSALPQQVRERALTELISLSNCTFLSLETKNYHPPSPFSILTLREHTQWLRLTIARCVPVRGECCMCAACRNGHLSA